MLENLSGIKNIVTNTKGGVKGSGAHRTIKDGYLEIHTDFNTYYDKKKKIKLDRRINILIYFNPDWKDEYKGDLKLIEKNNKNNIKIIKPILNRCVIFNTNSKSWHGHDIPLNTPENVYRDSIANYYYTKSIGDTDFEGDKCHTTRWWINNFKDINGN